MKKIFFLLIIIINTMQISANDQLTFDESLAAMKMLSSFNTYNASSTAVEIFGQTTQYRSPTLEAMGSGRAMQMFCNSDYSLVFVSRNIRKSELKQCQANKTGDIIEISLGHDSIIFVQNKEVDDLSLTYDDLYHALINETFINGKSYKNNYKSWNQVNENLPGNKIKIYGPTAGSGTREMFINQVIKPKCIINPEVFNIINTVNVEEFCTKIRNDEHYIDHGDDLLTLIKKIQLDQEAIGMVNYYVLQTNQNQIKPIKINNIEPNEENIISGMYTLSVPIIVYFKKNHMKNDLKNFIKDITSSKALGKNGYFTRIGINGKKIIDLKEIKIS